MLLQRMEQMDTSEGFPVNGKNIEWLIHVCEGVEELMVYILQRRQSTRGCSSIEHKMSTHFVIIDHSFLYLSRQFFITFN
jgi:hypothetical protein